jgi:glucose/arabinose dehydrogenase
MSRTRTAALAAALVASAGVAAVVLPGSAMPQSSATYTVRVEVRDFSFTLSRRSVPAASAVKFVVRNRGRATQRFSIRNRRTRPLGTGQSQTLRMAFPTKGAYQFRFTVGNRARPGMRGTFTVSAEPAPPPPPPSPPPLDVSASAVLTQIGTFARPVFVTAPADDERIFVVEQTGTVRVIRDGQVLPTPFLNLHDQAVATGESGLLSIAFAPDYAESGLVYAFYNARSGPYGDIRISEFRRSPGTADAVDLSSERVVLTIEKPYENHNGGMLQFAPDGTLYASVGDGDPGALYPPGFFAQRLDVLLGTILRINPLGGDPYTVPHDNPFVDTVGARPEIWAYGLRNPWRFWLDAPTRDLIIADVGSTSREEVNVVPAGQSGANFGWPCFEGSLVFNEAATCEGPVQPLLEIPRENGVCAIIGGVVARDARIPALVGRYLYGDLCSGTITAISIQSGAVAESDVLEVRVPGLTSFGIDGESRVYATSARGGVYRLDPTPS